MGAPFFAHARTCTKCRPPPAHAIRTHRRECAKTTVFQHRKVSKADLVNALIIVHVPPDALLPFRLVTTPRMACMLLFPIPLTALQAVAAGCGSDNAFHHIYLYPTLCPLRRLRVFETTSSSTKKRLVKKVPFGCAAGTFFCGYISKTPHFSSKRIHSP